MSYNPHITAARRAAKQMARDHGLPYQASLDALARRAGRVDWDAFLTDPAPIPDDIPDDIPEDAAKRCHSREAMPPRDPISLEAAPIPSHDEAPATTEQPRRRRARMRVIGFIVGVLALFAFIQWRYWQESVIVAGLNADYGNERAAAFKTLVPEISADRDAYVSAWALTDGRRRVYLTYFDWRPVIRGTVRDAISAVRHSMGYDAWYLKGYRDHPVFRVQGLIDCRTGYFRSTGGFLADDMVSKAAKRVGNPRPRFLLGPARDGICGDDVLERTKRVEKMNVGVATVDWS